MTKLLKKIMISENTKWLMEEGSVRHILGLIDTANEKMAEIPANLPAAQFIDEDNFWPTAGTFLAELRPYNVKDGILTIPIEGALIHNFPYAFFGFVTGYDYIRMAVQRGLSDTSVKSIVLEFDSGGGTVHGCFELANYIYAARNIKPIISMVNGAAFSAAYALACSADAVYLSVGSESGSVGIVVTHYDISKALEAEGVNITLLHAGKKKVEGNPYQPLSESAKKSINDEINDFYDIFCLHVAKTRGISIQSVKDTEAGTFGAKKSVKVGFADSGDNLDAIRTALVKMSSDKKGASNMLTAQQKALLAAAGMPAAEDATSATAPVVQPQAAAQTITQPPAVANTIEVSPAPQAQAAPIDTDKIANEAVTADRERRAAVVASPEYTGRETQAEAILIDPLFAGFSADDITAHLATMPLGEVPTEAPADADKTKAPAKAGEPGGAGKTSHEFTTKMQKEGSPDVGTEQIDESVDGDMEEITAGLLASHKKFNGASSLLDAPEDVVLERGMARTVAIHDDPLAQVPLGHATQQI